MPFFFIIKMIETVAFHQHIAQRHIFLFESQRWAFRADFIEHLFAALHTQADFEVNSLCAKAPFHNMLGLKVPFDVSKEEITNTIVRKYFTAKKGS
jgi:hypothetical protein